MIPANRTYRILGGVLAIWACTLAWTAWGNRERVLLTGSFHSVAHKGSGDARVLALRDGRRVLRLERVKTYPGEDLDVCLVAAPDAEDNDTVKQSGPVCVGRFAGTKTYEVPEAVDLNRYRAVAIWSRGYGVNFTTAPLTP